MFGEEASQPAPEPEPDEEAEAASIAERLQWERDLLGAYVSQHPLQAAAAALEPRVTAQLSELSELAGSKATVGGLVNSLRERQTRRGDTFAVVELEDLSGTAELTVWPEQYQRTRAAWTPNQIVVAELTVKQRGEGLLSCVVESVDALGDSALKNAPAAPAMPIAGRDAPVQPARPPSQPNGTGPSPAASSAAAPATVPPLPAPEPPAPTPVPNPAPVAADVLWVTIDETGDQAEDGKLLGTIEQLLKGFRAMGGSTRVYLRVRSGGSETLLELPPEWTVRADEAAVGMLGSSLGDRGSAEVQPGPSNGAAAAAAGSIAAAGGG